MFNPYNVQGGTATIDPQFSGMNGQSRIPDVIGSPYPQNAPYQPGVFPVAGVQSTFSPYSNFATNYTNFVPSAHYGWNTVPSSFVAPTTLNPYAFQPTVGAMPTTHFGIPSVYSMTNPITGWNPLIPSIAPFAGVSQMTGHHPMSWANNLVNPFVGVTNPFVGTTINPFTGLPVINHQQSPWGMPFSTPFGVNPVLNHLTHPFVNPITAVTAQQGLTNPYNAIVSPVVQNILRSIQSPFASFNPYNTVNPFVTNPWSAITSLNALNCCSPTTLSWQNPAACSLYGCSPLNYGSLTFANPFNAFPTIGGYSFPGSINNIHGNPFVSSIYSANPGCFNPQSSGYNAFGYSPISQTLGFGTNPFFGQTQTPIAAALNNAACWPACLN